MRYELQSSCRRFGLIRNLFGLIEAWTLGKILKSETQFTGSNFGRISAERGARCLNYTWNYVNIKLSEKASGYNFRVEGWGQFVIILEESSSKDEGFKLKLRFS